MKQPLIIATALVLLVACNNNDASTKKSVQPTTVTPARNILIAELKKLQRAVASNNKEKIADIFPFPLPEEALSIYTDDTTYYNKLKLNGGTITRQMFLKYFKEVSENIWLDQMNNLFKCINLDSLVYKDILEKEAYIETEPCYYSYQAEIIEDSIILSLAMNSNKSYKSSKQNTEDDIPENASEICEHVIWWIFRFDGTKLHFKRITGAD